jgi:hypothetical protein
MKPMLIPFVPMLSRELIADAPSELWFRPASLKPPVICGTMKIMIKKPMASIKIVITKINVSVSSPFLFIDFIIKN